MATSLLRLAFAVSLLAFTASPSVAQNASAPLDEEGRLVQFARDIAPIFASKCLECHNEKNAKNDFRIDTPDSIIDYIESGDGAGSTLMVEYLVSDDPDMLMPPASHGGPLSASELALIRVWIDEGANWPAGALVLAGQAVGKSGTAGESAPTKEEAKTLAARLWAFQGYFHPATVHFPIALLLVGGMFVVIGWRYPILGDHVALSCLFIGTLSSIVATSMGWAFAVQRGYGSWSRVDLDSEIFWHRWSAIFVTVLAIITSIIAIAALKKSHAGLRKLWKVGLLVLAALIGAVGHQGGEMTYGASHYQQAFELIFGKVIDVVTDEPADAVPPVAPDSPTATEAAGVDTPAVEPDASAAEAEAATP